VKEKSTELKTYDGSWEALQKMPVPVWLDDRKTVILPLFILKTIMRWV
jgi:hypothetical protein